MDVEDDTGEGGVRKKRLKGTKKGGGTMAKAIRRKTRMEIKPTAVKKNREGTEGLRL